MAAQGVEGLLQDRLEELQLDPVVGEELAHVLGVVGRDARDLGLEPVHVVGGADLAARLEHEVVLRIEPLELDVVLEPLAAGLEDVGEDLRIEEEGRADVEAEAAGRLDRLGAAADRRVLLQQRDVDAGPGEEQRGGEAAGTGTDDDDAASGQGPQAVP